MLRNRIVPDKETNEVFPARETNPADFDKLDGIPIWATLKWTTKLKFSDQG